VVCLVYWGAATAGVTIDGGVAAFSLPPLEVAQPEPRNKTASKIVAHVTVYFMMESPFKMTG
jgi:hypothetical protein